LYQVTEGSIITQIYGGAVWRFQMKHTAKNSPTAFENTERNLTATEQQLNVYG
jgi:hypothetical protein